MWGGLPPGMTLRGLFADRQTGWESVDGRGFCCRLILLTGPGSTARGSANAALADTQWAQTAHRWSGLFLMGVVGSHAIGTRIAPLLAGMAGPGAQCRGAGWLWNAVQSLWAPCAAELVGCGMRRCLPNIRGCVLSAVVWSANFRYRRRFDCLRPSPNRTDRVHVV